MSDEKQLPQSLGLSALIIYGVGDMLGAGIYGLIGAAAGVLGSMIWAGFAISALAAFLTALSYASLGCRYPKAGGAAYVASRAFGLPSLSYVTGLAVMASGLISMAAAARAFAGYAAGIVPFAAAFVLVLFFIGILGLINFLGMRESARMNLFCTILEAGGLIFIIAIGISYWPGADLMSLPKEDPHSLTGTAVILFQGAVLTFYAFLGFEDLLNVAEEVKNPARNFAPGILGALIITTLIYMAVSITAVAVVPHAELASSTGGPLVKVVERAAPWMDPRIFGLIAVFAIANTALLNYIMASRLAFGMAREGLLPAHFARLHSVRKTPHIAIVTIFFIVAVLASLGDISSLASATSLLLLIVFILMNAALLVLKSRKDEPKGSFEIPAAIPVLAILINVSLLTARIFAPDKTPLYIAGGMIAGITIIYIAGRKMRESVSTS